MFVLNAVAFDRRVQREAASLTSIGCDVTVFGTTDAAGALPLEERHPDGFKIIRVPIPPRSPLWVSRRSDFADAVRSARVGPWTATRTANALASAPWWIVRGVVAAGAFALHAASGGNANWLLNGRSRWRQWRRAVLAATTEADVYHGHDLTGLGVAVAAQRRFGGKVVYDSHDLFVDAGSNARRPRAVRRVLTELERRWYQRADLVVTVNQGLADELRRRYGRKPIAVVHNCVSVSEWVPDRTVGPLRRAIGIDADTPLVLYHGGFTANRGLGVLINAMRQPGLERAHLALLGYGPMEEELRRVAGGSASGGRVHVLPAVPPTELDRYVADADIAAMVNQPVSKNEILSTPNKLFESIAAGVPIVTSDFPMRRAIVLDNDDGPLGAVCDPERPQSVATAIRELLGLPAEELRAMRERCRTAAVRRWNWSREASTLQSAYDDLLTVRVSERAAESGAARL